MSISTSSNVTVFIMILFLSFEFLVALIIGYCWPEVNLILDFLFVVLVVFVFVEAFDQRG